MKKIIDYHILGENLQSNLEKAVLGYIIQGWQPFGSLGIGNNNNPYNFYQAMVKYENEVHINAGIALPSI